MANEREYPNSGILFRNIDKKSDKHPTHRGDANLTCVHCGAVNAVWLSAWVKEGRKGKFFSLSYRSKQDSASAALHDERR
jgi:hypothetical protein